MGNARFICYPDRTMAFLMALVALINSACALEPAAFLAQSNGLPEVSIASAEGKLRVVKPRAPLFEGDKIITAINQSVVIELGESNQAVVGPSSQLLIQAFNDHAPQQTQLELVKGLIRVWVKKLHGTGASFQVKTPTAIMGVRGTIFYVEVDQARKQTVLRTIEGQVVAAPAGTLWNDQAKFVSVGPGHLTTIAAGARSVPTPRPFDVKSFEKGLKTEAETTQTDRIEPSEPLSFPNGLEKKKRSR